MSAELFFFLSSYKYLALLPNPNKANSPNQQALIKKTFRCDPTQKASEADFHRFLRTRKNIEMVQTKHCDD